MIDSKTGIRCGNIQNMTADKKPAHSNMWRHLKQKHGIENERANRAATTTKALEKVSDFLQIAVELVHSTNTVVLIDGLGGFDATAC